MKEGFDATELFKDEKPKSLPPRTKSPVKEAAGGKRDEKEDEVLNVGAKVIGCLLVLGLIVMFAPLGILYYAWALSTLYVWFVLPLGAPVISFWHLYGLTCFTALFFPHSRIIPKKRDTKVEICFALMLPISCVFLGWIVKTFLM